MQQPPPPPQINVPQNPYFPLCVPFYPYLPPPLPSVNPFLPPPMYPPPGDATLPYMSTPSINCQENSAVDGVRNSLSDNVKTNLYILMKSIPVRLLDYGNDSIPTLEMDILRLANAVKVKIMEIFEISADVIYCKADESFVVMITGRNQTVNKAFRRIVNIIGAQVIEKLRVKSVESELIYQKANVRLVMNNSATHSSGCHSNEDILFYESGSSIISGESEESGELGESESNESREFMLSDESGQPVENQADPEVSSTDSDVSINQFAYFRDQLHLADEVLFKLYFEWTNSVYKEVVIEGAIDPVYAAKHIVNYLAHKKSEGFVERLNIPKVYHRFLLDARGIDSPPTGSETDVNVFIPRWMDNTDVLVYGKTSAALDVCQQLYDIYSEAEKKFKTLSVQVSRSYHRLVCGVRGEFLQEIFERTRVSVDAPYDLSHKTYTLVGPSDRLHEANRMLYEKVISIGTRKINICSKIRKLVFDHQLSLFGKVLACYPSLEFQLREGKDAILLLGYQSVLDEACIAVYGLVVKLNKISACRDCGHSHMIKFISKWCSNCLKILNGIPDKENEQVSSVDSYQPKSQGSTLPLKYSGVSGDDKICPMSPRGNLGLMLDESSRRRDANHLQTMDCHMKPVMIASGDTTTGLLPFILSAPPPATIETRQCSNGYIASAASINTSQVLPQIGALHRGHSQGATEAYRPIIDNSALVVLAPGQLSDAYQRVSGVYDPWTAAGRQNSVYYQADNNSSTVIPNFPVSALIGSLAVPDKVTSVHCPTSSSSSLTTFVRLTDNSVAARFDSLLVDNRETSVDYPTVYSSSGGSTEACQPVAVSGSSTMPERRTSDYNSRADVSRSATAYQPSTSIASLHKEDTVASAIAIASQAAMAVGSTASAEIFPYFTTSSLSLKHFPPLQGNINLGNSRFLPVQSVKPTLPQPAVKMLRDIATVSPITRDVTLSRVCETLAMEVSGASRQTQPQFAQVFPLPMPMTSIKRPASESGSLSSSAVDDEGKENVLRVLPVRKRTAFHINLQTIPLAERNDNASCNTPSPATFSAQSVAFNLETQFPSATGSNEMVYQATGYDSVVINSSTASSSLVADGMITRYRTASSTMEGAITAKISSTTTKATKAATAATAATTAGTISDQREERSVETDGVTDGTSAIDVAFMDTSISKAEAWATLSCSIPRQYHNQLQKNDPDGNNVFSIANLYSVCIVFPANGFSISAQQSDTADEKMTSHDIYENMSIDDIAECTGFIGGTSSSSSSGFSGRNGSTGSSGSNMIAGTSNAVNSGNHGSPSDIGSTGGIYNNEFVTSVANPDEILISGKLRNCVSARSHLLTLINFTLEMDIPNDYHRHIIGSKGRKIQYLMSEYKVQIHIPPCEQKSDTVTLTGAKWQVMSARCELLRMMERLKALNAQKDSKNFYFDLKVDPKYHAKLIGRGGAEVNKLKHQYNVQIDFSKKGSPTPDIVRIRGVEENAYLAGYDILSRVADLEKQHKLEFHLDARTHSRLIGFKGQNIIKIMEEFDVEVKFPGRISPTPTLVIIVGEQNKVEKCRQRLITLAEVCLKDIEEIERIKKRRSVNNAARAECVAPSPNGSVTEQNKRRKSVGRSPYLIVTDTSTEGL